MPKKGKPMLMNIPKQHLCKNNQKVYTKINIHVCTCSYMYINKQAAVI